MDGGQKMELIGKEVRSKNTHAKGIITDFDNKAIYVNFEATGSIPIPIRNVTSLLDMDDEILQTLLTFPKENIKSERKKKDPDARKEGTENIAFKITYCDGGETETRYGFRKECSSECRIANQKNGRAWCNEKLGLCGKLANNMITQEEYDNESAKGTFFCYESRILVDWKAYAGTDNTKNPPRPRRFNQLCSSGIAVLTTVPNDTKERYIFALFKIVRYFEGDETAEGYVEADPRYRIEFDKEESKQMRFWDFYSNKNQSEQWGTGLFRYLSNEQVLLILKKALEIKEGKQDYPVLKELAEVFCREKNLNL